MEVQVKLVPTGIDEDGEEQHLELDAAIVDTLKPLLREAVERKVDKVSDKVIKTAVEEHVAKLSIEAFSGVFQATDCWGKPKGDAKSLPEIVSGMVEKYLEAKVDSRGAPNYSGQPRCQWMVLKAIQGAVEGEIDKRLSTLRTEFSEHIVEKLSKVKVS